MLDLLEQELAWPVRAVGQLEGQFEGLGRLWPVALDVRLDAGAPSCWREREREREGESVVWVGVGVRALRVRQRRREREGERVKGRLTKSP